MNHSAATPPARTALGRREALLLGGTALLASRGAHAQAPAKPTGQVIVGLSQEPTVFNPLMPAIEVDQGVWWNLFNPLWGVDAAGNFTPQLATEIPSLENGGISADGLTWKVKLRDGVTWHDGQKFSAEDVKFTLELINNASFRAGSRQGHNLVHDIAISGPNEITWRMERAYAPYLSLLAWTFIVPKHILSGVDANTAPFNNAPIGTGPFRWSERVPGDHLTLVANPNYFGKGPYLERVVFKYIPDLNAMYTQFRTGQIDHLSIDGLQANFYEEAKTLKGRVVSVNPSVAIEYVAPNHGSPILGDKAVRQALYAGINKQSIIDLIYYGLPKPTESFLPPESWAYNPDLPAHKYDLAAGNAILDKAGWTRSGNVRMKDGKRLEFSISTTSGNALREQVQQLLLQDWQQLGAAVKIENKPAAVMWGDFWIQSKYQSALVGSTFMTGNDPDCSYRFNSAAIPAKGGAGSNVYQYVNPEVDKQLLIGQSSFDRDVRRTAYQKVQAMVRDDLAILPIYRYRPVEGYREGLQGYQANVNVRSNCWNIGTWYWAKA